MKRTYMLLGLCLIGWHAAAAALGQDAPKTDSRTIGRQKTFGTVQTVTAGDWWLGTLHDGDPRDTVRGTTCNVCIVTLEQGVKYQIDMTGRGPASGYLKRPFDAYLRLEDGDGRNLDSDDDSGFMMGLDARISLKCPVTGEYRIVATTFDGINGSYRLRVLRESTPEFHIARGLDWSDFARFTGIDPGEKKRRYETAIQEFTKAVNLDPKNAVAWYERGLVRYFEDDYDQAIDDFTVAIETKPSKPYDALAFYYRGAAKRGKKAYDKAIDDYNEAIKIDPKYAPAYNDLGVASEDKNDPAAAIAAYLKAIEIDKNYKFPNYNLGNIWRAKNQYDKAVQYYDRAIAIDPTYASAYYYRGAALHSNKDYDQAIAGYTQAILLNPNNLRRNNWDNVDAYNYRGNAWKAKKLYDEAIADYTHALKLDSKYVETYLKRGNAYLARKDHARAIDDFERATELAPIG